MGTAWTLMSTNIARMAKALWLPAVITALLCALTAAMNAHQRAVVTDGNINFGILIQLFVLSLLLVMSSVYLDSKIFKLLNLQSFKWCLQRTIKAFCIHLVMVLAAVTAVWGIATSDILLASSGKLPPAASLLLFLGELLIAAILLLAFFTPMIYALVKYMIEPETTLKTIWQSYRTGLRNVSFIVAFYLLCSVVLVIAYLVTALPAVIITAASAMSNLGVAMGDPSGLPGYFTALYAVTIFITSFVAILLRIWSVFAAYYMYASIEAKNGRTDVPDDAEGE